MLYNAFFNIIVIISLYNYCLYFILLLGIGDWGLGIGPNPQSTIPNPQSPNKCIIIIL